ncbi:MAG: DctP family TRAP transporter solute-binding subunit [Oscillospiraceae bacterium]|nr:DctP family TRAP transporter solute-binding subunit [Oscillospiraceae bacterium]
MRRKRIQTIGAILTLALLVTGCANSGTEQREDGKYQTIELTMAVNGTDNQIDALVGDYFAQLVSERSGGNVTVAVFPNDQLANGNASRGIEMIASGSIDLAAYATCTLAVIDEKLPVATIPWIFDDYAQAREVIDTTGGEYYAQRLAMKGMTYLGSFHNGFRQITNSKHEVTTPADMENLKIRVPGSVVYMGFFRALGADPTSMNWSEVFTAIQQGTIDGQENGVSITSTSKMQEVQDYLTMWNYSYENDLFVANTEIWESLEPQTQELLQECATEACEWGRDVLEEEEAEILKEFEAAGMTITYLTEEEQAAFDEAIASFKAEMEAYFGPEACAAFGITN